MGRGNGFGTGSRGYQPTVERRWRLSVLAGSAVLIGSAVAGCAGADGLGPGEVADRFVDTVGSGDLVAACALLAPATVEALTTSSGRPCPESLEVELPSVGSVASPEVDEWSGWARVDSERGAVYLTEGSDGWRVAAAGCVPSGDGGPDRCVVDN